MKFSFELNFAVNVLGTFTVTELLLPLLEKTAPDAKVITVASGGMYTAPLTEDLQVIFCTNIVLRHKYISGSSTILIEFGVILLLMQFSDAKFEGVQQYARNKRVQVS